MLQVQNQMKKNEPRGAIGFLGALGLIGVSTSVIPSKKLHPFITGVRPTPGELRNQSGTGSRKSRKRVVFTWKKLYK